ncbi:MAG: methyl-accepting chemotaxis protein [Bacillota bacterium]|nr:methyl-accepting chemotaxis protein [Bacillota bacterium]
MRNIKLRTKIFFLILLAIGNTTLLGLYNVWATNQVIKVSQAARSSAQFLNTIRNIGLFGAFSASFVSLILGMVIFSLIGKIRQVAIKVESVASQLSLDSDNLAASAKTVGCATQQVATTIRQLAIGAEEQAKETLKTQSIIASMSQSIQQVASAAEEMASAATLVVTAGESGKEAVNQNIRQMNLIKEVVGETASVVKVLDERSRQIGHIIEFITDISDKTDLLALNAAIEAAHAGERGRGFAVVSEEVRKLSEQARGSTRQIAELIQQIQDEITRTAAMMDNGMREVALGSKVVEDTGQTFETILAKINDVAAKIRAISAETKSLAAGEKEIVDSVQSIAAITQESAAGAEEVSASAQQQSASIEEIANAVERLAEMAQELQAGIAFLKTV